MQASRPRALPAKTVAADQVDGFLAIDAKGNVTVYSGKVDLGTGIRTAMTQIAAEELSVPLDRVTVIQGDTLLTPDQGITCGSLSIQNGGMQIRQAAATARAGAAGRRCDEARRSTRTPSSSRTASSARKPAARVSTYAALVGGKDFRLAVDAKAPTKDPKDYTIVGKPVARLDIPDKVTGRFTYMHDFRRKGMLHARVIRPAGDEGDAACRGTISTAARFRATSASSRRAISLPCLRVASGRRSAASRAIETKWSDWTGLPDQAKLWEYVRATKVAKDEDLQKVGDVEAEAQDAEREARVRDLRLRDPHARLDRAVVRGRRIRRRQAHRAGRASQQTHLLRKQIAHDARHEARRRSLHLHRGLRAATAATGTRTRPPTPR